MAVIESGAEAAAGGAITVQAGFCGCCCEEDGEVALALGTAREVWAMPRASAAYRCSATADLPSVAVGSATATPASNVWMVSGGVSDWIDQPLLWPPPRSHQIVPVPSMAKTLSGRSDQMAADGRVDVGARSGIASSVPLRGAALAGKATGVQRARPSSDGSASTVSVS